MMQKFISLFIPMFILMDFIGTLPVFISLTRKKEPRERARIAILSSIVAGGFVSVFALSGKQILEYFDISIEAVKAGGGLLLLYIAFEMILSGQLLYDKSMDDPEERSIIVSPLAIPMLAGPGSMTFAMIVFLESPGFEKIYLFAAIILSVICGAMLLSISSFIQKILGNEFTRGLEKVTAIIVSFIALEMIMSGIKGYFFP